MILNVVFKLYFQNEVKVVKRMKYERKVPLKYYKFRDYSNFYLVFKRLIYEICDDTSEIEVKIINSEYIICLNELKGFLEYFESGSEFFSFELTIRNQYYEVYFKLHTFENLNMKTLLTISSNDKKIIGEMEANILLILKGFRYRPFISYYEVVQMTSCIIVTMLSLTFLAEDFLSGDVTNLLRNNFGAVVISFILGGIVAYFIYIFALISSPRFKFPQKTKKIVMLKRELIQSKYSLILNILVCFIFFILGLLIKS